MRGAWQTFGKPKQVVWRWFDAQLFEEQLTLGKVENSNGFSGDYGETPSESAGNSQDWKGKMEPIRILLHNQNFEKETKFMKGSENNALRRIKIRHEIIQYSGRKKSPWTPGIWKDGSRDAGGKKPKEGQQTLNGHNADEVKSAVVASLIQMCCRGLESLREAGFANRWEIRERQNRQVLWVLWRADKL